ncbi:MAG: plasmid stabilization protein [Alphaproteobacteria bacterium]|nr:plasmid stabilization protein [Alphaproteobacteria bacterium]
MTQVTIRNIDPTAIEHLKRRAARHGHSLREELREIPMVAADSEATIFYRIARAFKGSLRGPLNRDSVELLRQDRDR